jgi:hypothetical protein
MLKHTTHVWRDDLRVVHLPLFPPPRGRHGGRPSIFPLSVFLLVHRPPHCYLSLPILNPLLQTRNRQTSRRTKKMNMVGHDHILTHPPEIRRLPYLSTKPVHRFASQNRLPILGANIHLHNDRFIESLNRSGMSRSAAISITFVIYESFPLLEGRPPRRPSSPFRPVQYSNNTKSGTPLQPPLSRTFHITRQL